MADTRIATLGRIRWGSTVVQQMDHHVVGALSWVNDADTLASTRPILMYSDQNAAVPSEQGWSVRTRVNGLEYQSDPPVPEQAFLPSALWVAFRH